MSSGWHDTELTVDCQLAPDPEGVQRGMPLFDNGYAVLSSDTKLDFNLEKARRLFALAWR